MKKTDKKQLDILGIFLFLLIRHFQTKIKIRRREKKNLEIKFLI